MDSDDNHRSLPADVPLTIEIDEEKPAAVPMTPSDDSDPMSSPGFHGCDLVDGEMKLIMEETVASAVASEKAKLRQLSIFLEKWVCSNNNNLYPSRMEKEGLAKRMNMTYVQVNRWFANRRRKVIKRTKVAPSPASVPPTAEPLVYPAESDGRIGISVPAEHLEAFLHAISAQQLQASSPSSTSSGPDHEPSHHPQQQAEMVMQQNSSSSETPLTPPADDQAAYSQIVPEMIPYQALEQAVILQKILQQLQPQLGAYNPNTLALLGLTPIHMYQAQLAAAQQLAIQQQLQAHLLAVHQEQQQQQQQIHQHNPNLWMQGGSISASPAHISDSEISEMSELSPPPLSSHVLRPHSPFKDPHGIADTDMLALMSLSKLSEREQQAVNILLELSTDVR